MIALVHQHLLEPTSMEKVENILPVYTKEIAAPIFSFIQKHLATETSTAASPLSEIYQKQLKDWRMMTIMYFP